MKKRSLRGIRGLEAGSHCKAALARTMVSVYLLIICFFVVGCLCCSSHTGHSGLVISHLSLCRQETPVASDHTVQVLNRRFAESRQAVMSYHHHPHQHDLHCSTQLSTPHLASRTFRPLSGADSAHALWRVTPGAGPCESLSFREQPFASGANSLTAVFPRTTVLLI